MDQQQALSVLIQAANLAQKRGAYNLEEASAIASAVAIFTTNSKTGLNTSNTSDTTTETEASND